MPHSVSITLDAIVPQDVLDLVGHQEDGAVLLFLGVVRNHNEGRAVGGLRYEAYPEMAEAVLADIAAEAAQRFGTDRIAVVHRVGDLGIGEIAVAVAVSSPHRAESFDGARYVMEELKRRLPVWKHEAYADGDAAWVEGTEPMGAGGEVGR